MAAKKTALSGRRAEAARNDERILDGARKVFVDDPTAPISAVAERAGVGIGALYHRYSGKEDLLRTLCMKGLEVYMAEAERALASDDDPWDAYVGFLQRIVEADTHSLTVRLAGTFTPTVEDLEPNRMQDLTVELFERAKATGRLRGDVTALDIAYLLEFLAGVRLGDETRTAELRQRQLAVIIDGLSSKSPTPLPGSAPTWEEQAARWMPR